MTVETFSGCSLKQAELTINSLIDFINTKGGKLYITNKDDSQTIRLDKHIAFTYIQPL